MKALFSEPLKDGAVRCALCGHRCVIGPGKRGRCHVRENRNGVLETLVYGRLVATHVDPVEKKPLFHLYPGSRSFSIATAGCNFTCRFCQNSAIAQMPADTGRVDGQPVSAEAVVAAAESSGCRSIAYTYTEPTIYFEFARDCAILARERGIANVFVTNGYMSPEALDAAAPWLDAANVDLKSFSDEFYRRYCGARLAPVLETLKGMTARGILVEVTTLIIPGLNDDPDELARLAGFVATELGPDTPWHVSRFHPSYRMDDRGATPLATLEMARNTGEKAGLRYVYMGNVPGSGGENTRCPGCGAVVVERRGFQVVARRLRPGNGTCAACGTAIHGVGMAS